MSLVNDFRLASFYDTVIPVLLNKLKSLTDNTTRKEQVGDVKKKICTIRLALLQTYRSILSSTCIHPLLTNR